MQDPSSPPKLTHPCPVCKGPVVVGDKFCETCGVRISPLQTCSKCGTRFIAPEKFCDLCGAPLVLEVEPNDSPEHDEDATSGSVEELIPERDDEELPDPDTDEVPEDRDEEKIIPTGDTSPRHDTKEIQEPDTEELLEKYGKEYDPDETLESSRKPKPRSPVKQEAKKPSPGFTQRTRGSVEAVDDALFLSPERPKTPAKPRVNRAAIILGCMVLIAVIAAVYFIGLPMISANSGTGTVSNPSVAGITSLPNTTIAGTISPTRTVTPITASKALIPQPTQTIPSGQNLYFQVQKSPITTRIVVTFAGSAGHNSIKSADVKVTHPDGSVSTGILQPLKGISEIILDGSKGTDRVEIIALMSEGESYRVYDELVPSMT